MARQRICWHTSRARAASRSKDRCMFVGAVATKIRTAGGRLSTPRARGAPAPATPRPRGPDRTPGRGPGELDLDTVGRRWRCRYPRVRSWRGDPDRNEGRERRGPGGPVESRRAAGRPPCANFHFQNSTCPCATPVGTERDLAQPAAPMRLHLPPPVRPPPRAARPRPLRRRHAPPPEMASPRPSSTFGDPSGRWGSPDAYLAARRTGPTPGNAGRQPQEPVGFFGH